MGRRVPGAPVADNAAPVTAGGRLRSAPRAPRSVREEEPMQDGATQKIAFALLMAVMLYAALGGA